MNSIPAFVLASSTRAMFLTAWYWLNKRLSKPDTTKIKIEAAGYATHAPTNISQLPFPVHLTTTSLTMMSITNHNLRPGSPFNITSTQSSTSS